MSKDFKDLVRNIKIVFFDFDGVFTDNSVYVDQSGREMVRCSRSDGIGIKRLALCGIDSVIVSSEVNSVVTERGKKLEIPVVQAIQDKAVAVRRLCSEREISLGDAAFVGNDVNDIPALSIIGVPIAVGDAFPEVKEICLHITRNVGGHGAVREVCDTIAKALESNR